MTGNNQNDWSVGEHLTLGSVVVDTEQSPQEQDEAVVVATPDATLDDWNVYNGDTTVAEDNPDYPVNDRVTIVVFREELDKYYPYYSGVYPLYLPELNERGVPYYAFPNARLEQLRVQRAHEICLDDVFPSPYHHRSFDFDGNEEFVAETKERGFPLPYPLVRVLSNGNGESTPKFEILDGHKRVWIAHVAGCKKIKAQSVYVDDVFAAGIYLQNHYHRLPLALKSRVEEEVRDRVDDVSSLNFTFSE